MLYAKFIGYQSDGRNGKFPLFDLVDPAGEHPYHLSTLSLGTLRKIGLDKIEFRGYNLREGKEAGYDKEMVQEI